MKKSVKSLAALALLGLAFTVPAAVVARSEGQAAPEPAAESQAAGDAGDEEELEEFEPTEKVNADEAISFPVDI